MDEPLSEVLLDEHRHRVCALLVPCPLTAERLKARVAQIPDGAEIVGVYYEDFGLCLRVGVRHPRFLPAEDGVPTLPVTCDGETAVWPWDESLPAED